MIGMARVYHLGGHAPFSRGCGPSNVLPVSGLDPWARVATRSEDRRIEVVISSWRCHLGRGTVLLARPPVP